MALFLIDAQVPPLLCRWLGDRGHDAVHVQDVGLAAADDPDIWALAVAQDRVLLAKD